MTTWSHTSQGIPNHIFHEVCEKKTNETVDILLEIGADPFSEDEQGVAAVTKAALSNVEPVEKLRSLMKFDITKVNITVLCNSNISSLIAMPLCK